MERAFLRFCGPGVPELPAAVPCGDGAVRDHRLAGLVEAFCFHAHGLLHEEEPGSEARLAACAFLADYGFDLAKLAELPVGLVVTPNAMKQRLLAAGFTQEEVRESKLVADQRLAGRLVGPITDPAGGITSFWARHPADRQPTYLYWHGDWRQHVAAFGLQSALRAADDAAAPVVLVEDILDALLLRSKGLCSVAAVGESLRRLNASRWERLAAAGARHVTLVADNRERAEARLLAALESAFAAEAVPSIDAVPPERLASARTPGGLVRSQGLGAFCRILEAGRVHAYTLKAHAVLRAHLPRRGWTDVSRRAAMQEAVAFYRQMSARRGDTAGLDAHFVPPIVEALGWPWGAPEAPFVPRPSAGYCALHRCGETDCFCFD